MLIVRSLRLTDLSPILSLLGFGAGAKAKAPEPELGRLCRVRGFKLSGV